MRIIFKNGAFIVVGIMVMLCGMGCRKQKSTLQEMPPVKSDTSFAEVNPFASVDTSDEATFREANLEEELARRAREALRPVYFEYNSFQLNSEATEQLVRAAEFLKQNAGIRVLIQGHCDERGSSEYNMGLGERRARAVREYLITIGIQPVRLEITSLGKEQPAEAGCYDENCHGKNRRSEFRPLGR